ncbi:long-chain-acyl-CoA synthetase [Microbulbifer agarilyticus]|uniref:long-chain-acyl-CoA synthetase n=1 Tax=Microbulbifer agarilyticus TaxID=260552 RepID=UPI001CD6A8AC|nr:long-chain-acyl-CoA synthetase [Microbulbifer agarilyticus]MCA0901209.1 long-chain-acyl-CoA synthetase [Microbulbifer agarilyticus]
MKKLKEFCRVIKEFLKVAPTLFIYKPPADDEFQSMGLLFEKTAEKYSDRLAIIFEGRELKWGEFNRLVNQFAHGIKSLGVQRGDVVSVFLDNRIELLASVLALAKIGATAALINNSLRGKPLAHCVTVAESKKILVGEEVLGAIEDVRSELELADKDYFWLHDDPIQSDSAIAPDWCVDFSAVVPTMSKSNPVETADIRAGEKALYIYTSGTTGLPKPAVIYHRRFLSAAVPYNAAGLQAKVDDRIYMCLPLYHITGLGPGFGSALVSGASIFLRRRFSASKFWSEVQEYRTNLFVYVGELCRYLTMQPECPEEKNNPIKTMMGNGLRPDVWDQFRQRFKVDRIAEIYGSSEGNAVFMNFLNKDRTIGASAASLMLAKYDVDNDELVRDPLGNLIEVEFGKQGLLLAEINDKYRFDGYKNRDASEEKIIRNVKKEGDSWFNTGDLIRQIDVGFAMGIPHFQFVDRVGDTFRWRAENVSTHEVAEVLNTCEQVDIANVYGVEVPGVEGRAGMVALTLAEGVEFDVESFATFVRKELPAHARPIFVRLQESAQTTVTFKLFKSKLKKEAYHLDKCSDRIYVLKPKFNTYEPLEQGFYQQLVDGTAGY